MIKSINDFLDSIPVAWKGYRWWKYLSKKALDSILTPVNVCRDLKRAKWFQQHLKALLFADKDISYIKWAWKAGLFLTLPAAAEITYEINSNWSWSLSHWNIALNYIELMYFWVINTLVFEYFNADELILWETP